MLAERNARRARPRPLRQKVNSILTYRERLIAEVAVLRGCGEASRFVDNAQQLLTRWWATANWNAREELLKTAAWLIQLEKCRGTQVRREA
jgi:hypothetical protein